MTICEGKPNEYFYPRPPRGGRHPQLNKSIIKAKFLSPPSARRATSYIHELAKKELISIPALREEGDRCRRCRVRLRHISIPALREEGDRYAELKSSMDENFYPRPPRGGRQQHVEIVAEDVVFLSPPSARRATSCKCRFRGL